jgi:lipid-A-disaccharide synthase
VAEFIESDNTTDRPPAAMVRPERRVLLTAFEPSGDAHAAPVVRVLRERDSELDIAAWGGQRMADAGARIVRRSADDAAMGLSSLKRIEAMRREIRSIREWVAHHRPAVHVAVDSPAANFPICAVTRRGGAKVVHLVAPQLWAWGGWRVRKLRRLTDLVLCLLPFEEPWFTERGVPARFIGHPRINREIDELALREAARGLPVGAPRIALLPGSRAHEVHANLRLLLETFAALRRESPDLTGVIVAAGDRMAQIIRRRAGALPASLRLTTGNADAAIAWADLCLAVSGTVTLDIARIGTPMIGIYRTTRFAVLVSRFLLRTPYRLLPNIIAGREIVPEFVPYAGGAAPIIERARDLLTDSTNAATQIDELAGLRGQFEGHDPATEAARSIIDLIEASMS